MQKSMITRYVSITINPPPTNDLLIIQSLPHGDLIINEVPGSALVYKTTRANEMPIPRADYPRPNLGWAG